MLGADRELVAAHGENRLVAAEMLQLEDRLAEAGSRLNLAATAPQEGCERVARHRPSRKGQRGKERPGLAGADLKLVARRVLKAGPPEAAHHDTTLRRAVLDALGDIHAQTLPRAGAFVRRSRRRQINRSIYAC